MPPDAPILRPVILAVPNRPDARPGSSVQADNRRLSRLAREALAHSARRSGRRLPTGELPKDDRGAPQPIDGLYWSLTHKPSYVGGVVSARPAGMDIETVRPVGDPLFRKIASDREWALCSGDRLRCFFRYWTAKEAALKATGAGIRDLARCRVADVCGRRRLLIDYRDRHWTLEHLFFDGHVATVVCPSGHQVRWMVRKPSAAASG